MTTSPTRVTPTTETAGLFYLLCVLEAGTPANEAVREGSLPGIEPTNPLFAIDAGKLVAVACEVPSAVFGEEPLNRLVSDMAALAPYALRHEAVIRQLCDLAPALLPMAFGAVFSHPDHIKALLTKQASAYRKQLDRIRGREEWSLLIFQDINKTVGLASTDSPKLQEMDAQIASASTGRAYILRKQREKLMMEEADRIAREGLAACLNRLNQRSVAVHQDDVPATMQPGAPAPVCKAAFLVERTSGDAFLSEVRALRSEYEALGFTIEMKGPWAPYSFVGAGQ